VLYKSLDFLLLMPYNKQVSVLIVFSLSLCN